MDKLLDNPWFLRFSALFLAILLFFTVKTDEVNMRKTAAGEDTEVIEDVPVEVFYDNENLIVSGVPETVNMTIEGPTNIVKSTKLRKDYSVIVDLTSLTIGEHQVQVRHENISDKLNVRIEPSTVTVKIEEKITERFKVQAELNERLLAEGYYVSSMDVEPTTIEVTGAKSVIESINFVKATISAEQGLNESFEQEAQVRVLDKDLNKLDLEIVPEKVLVKVNIEENSKEVPLILNEVGTPTDDIVIRSVKAETDKITISGSKRALNDIHRITVDFDVSKIKKSGTYEVKLEKPTELSKMSIETLKVIVEVGNDDAEETAPDEDVTLEDSPENEGTNVEVFEVKDIPITLVGLNDRFKATVIQPTAGTLSIHGEAVNMSLGKHDFKASVDLSDITEEGEYTYPILVEGPTNVEWVTSINEATVKIELT